MMTATWSCFHKVFATGTGKEIKTRVFPPALAWCNLAPPWAAPHPAPCPSVAMVFLCFSPLTISSPCKSLTSAMIGMQCFLCLWTKPQPLIYPCFCERLQNLWHLCLFSLVANPFGSLLLASEMGMIHGSAYQPWLETSWLQSSTLSKKGAVSMLDTMWQNTLAAGSEISPCSIPMAFFAFFFFSQKKKFHPHANKAPEHCNELHFHCP